MGSQDKLRKRRYKKGKVHYRSPLGTWSYCGLLLVSEAEVVDEPVDCQHCLRLLQLNS